MKTGAINIYKSNLDAKDFELSLNELLSNGWSANKNGLIVYVADDSYEPLSMPYSNNNLKVVTKKLYGNVSSNIIAAIDLVYGNNQAVIGLYFVNDENEKSIMITIPEDTIFIDGMDVIDFSWYLDKIKGIFLFLDFYRLACSFD